MTDNDAAGRMQRAVAAAFTDTAETKTAEVAKVETATPVESSKSDPAKPEQAEVFVEAHDQTLAKLIRQQREVHAQRQRETQERNDLKTRLAAAEAQLAKSGKSDIVSDPIGFAESHGLTKEEMALIGQAYLYHFVPEKAPADLRTKLLEAKIARQDREREAKAAEDAKKVQQAQEQQSLNVYAAQLNAAIPSFAGKYPESEAWFSGNLKNYHLSLMNTANNMASAALKAGKVADLRPEAVAAVLEQHLAARMTAREKARQGKSQQTQSVEKQSTESKTQSHTQAPTGPLTAEERIRRAMLAGFPGAS